MNRFDEFKAKAEAGDAEAQYQLGLIFQHGFEAKRDIKTAIEWWAKAARQGNVAAANQLGWIHLSGHVEKNPIEAIKWYRHAADHGSIPALYYLGAVYADGRGVEKNGIEAIKWMRLAANQGHAEAQYRLGRMYDEGLGVEKSVTEAEAWLRKAAAQRHAKANISLRQLKSPPVPSPESDPPLATMLNSGQAEWRIISIHSMEHVHSDIHLVATVAAVRQFLAVRIICIHPATFTIRPPNGATIMGGPLIEFHEKHPLLDNPGLQYVPVGDGDVFEPPRFLKLLILDQSHVIAERFTVHKYIVPPTPPSQARI